MPERYESRDIGTRAIEIFAGALIVAVVVVLLLTGGLLAWLSAQRALHDPEPRPLREPDPPPAGPIVVVDLEAALDKLRADEREQLGTYAWIDRDRGIARIPIDRAMDLLLERGLPVREKKP